MKEDINISRELNNPEDDAFFASIVAEEEEKTTGNGVNDSGFIEQLTAGRKFNRYTIKALLNAKGALGDSRREYTRERDLFEKGPYSQSQMATHPSCPPVKGRQRAEVIIGGFIVDGVTDDPPVCKVTFVTRADLKGKIPASMVNKVNEKQPLYAGVIRDKMEERFMFQDPPHEGDVKINAARMHPSLREKREIKPKPNGNIAATEVEQKNEIQQQKPEAVGKDDSDLSSDESLFRTNSANNITPVPNNKRLRELSNEEKDALFRTVNDWDTMSESSISSVDQAAEFQDPIGGLNGYVKPLAEQSLDLPRDPTGNVDFKTLGNQAAANLLEEVLLASKVDIQKKVTEYVDVPGTWSFQGVFRNVVVLRKIHKDCNIHSFLGRGVMNVLPVTIWESIKNPSSRFVYDNMLKKTKIAKEISDGLKVIHMRHETNACFVKQSRDFVVLTGERVDHDKYILCGTSVEIPECPLERNCVRGNVLASGWIIEPVLNQGKPCSLVTYLSQIDFGGRLPIRLINHIAKRQPMSIAYLRTYLEAAEKRS